MGFVKDPVIIPRRVAVEPTPTVLPTSGPLQPWNGRNTPDFESSRPSGCLGSVRLLRSRSQRLVVSVVAILSLGSFIDQSQDALGKKPNGVDSKTL